MSKYFGDFDDYESMTRQWSGSDAVTDAEVICADYNRPDYDGYANCYFQRDGKVFEVYESHCSCNGLDRWDPEETSFEAILMRGGLDPQERALLEAARDGEQKGKR